MFGAARCVLNYDIVLMPTKAPCPPAPLPWPQSPARSRSQLHDFQRLTRMRLPPPVSQLLSVCSSFQTRMELYAVRITHVFRKSPGSDLAARMAGSVCATELKAATAGPKCGFRCLLFQLPDEAATRCRNRLRPSPPPETAAKRSGSRSCRPATKETACRSIRQGCIIFFSPAPPTRGSVRNCRDGVGWSKTGLLVSSVQHAGATLCRCAIEICCALAIVLISECFRRVEQSAAAIGMAACAPLVALP